MHVPLLRAGGRLFTTVKRPPKPLRVRLRERAPAPLRGGKLFDHPKNPRSPTHNVTQERRTQTLRSLGCDKCLMLLEAHRHRGNLARKLNLVSICWGKQYDNDCCGMLSSIISCRPCRLLPLHVSLVVDVTGLTLVAPMCCPRSLAAHDAATIRSAPQSNAAVAAGRRPPSTYLYL